MVPTFPPEIWLRIGQLIPSRILRNLYSVNSVFLELALNERYSEISLAIYSTVSSTKNLEHLKWPHIAHRVKRLTILTDWFMANLCMSLHFVEKITTRMVIAWSLPFDLGRFIDRTSWIMFRSKKYHKSMARLVTNFPNISHLVIVEGPGSTSPQPETDILVVNSYTVCASNLKILSLIIKSADFNAFPPNASELKSVEQVDLSFSPPFGSSPNPKAASAFLLAIASRLTILNLSFNDTKVDEISKLLQSFPQGRAAFPKLTSFSLSHAGPPTAPSPKLTQFLNQHADTLKHLRLQFTKPSPFTPQSFDDLGHPVPIILPHIETLNLLNISSIWSCTIITDLGSHEGLDAALAYAQHSGSTLTSLSLSHCSLTLHDLGVLLDLLAQGSGGLKTLAVTVEALSPQMLDILAEKLPQLEKLMVTFTFLRSCDVPGVSRDVDLSRAPLMLENFEPFLLEMEARHYQNWSLTSLALDHSLLRICMDSDVATKFLFKLALCIPHLVEINEPSLQWKRPGLEYEWTKYEYVG